MYQYVYYLTLICLNLTKNICLLFIDFIRSKTVTLVFIIWQLVCKTHILKINPLHSPKYLSIYSMQKVKFVYVNLCSYDENKYNFNSD